MSYVMVYHGVAGQVIGDSDPVPLGSYLKEYDVDAHDGRGAAIWTTVLSEALTWKEYGDAFRTWQKRSTVRPTRMDGKANRPLTAFTVEIKRA